MYRLSDFEKSSRNLYKLGKILSVIICMIILLLILFNLTFMIEIYINPNKLPSFLGIKSLIIVSESMEPTIMTDDVIFIKDVSKEGKFIIFQHIAQHPAHGAELLLQAHFVFLFHHAKTPSFPSGAGWSKSPPPWVWAS